MTGKSNTEDASEKGKYTFFDRSSVIKKSNKYIYDGKYTIIPGEGIFEPKYANGKFDLHQRAYAISSKYYIPKYLFYLIKKNKNIFYKYSVGSTVPSLRSSSFEWINNIKIVSMKTQKQIIDIIEPIELIIELISVVKKNIIGFLDKIHKFLPKRKFKIKEIGDVFIGTTPYTKNKNNWSDKVKGESWINSERLTKSIISKKSKKYVSKMAYDKMIKANKGDLLFSIIDPSKDKISLAREKLTFNQSIALIKATKNLFFEIREAMRFFNKIKSGSAQQSINKSDIENTYVKLTNVKYEEFFKFLIEFNFLKDKILSMKSKILDLLISIY